MPLLIGHDATVANWVAGKLGVTIVPPYTALGVLDGAGTLIGGAVFHGHCGASIDVTIYGPRAVTRGILRATGQYVFGQLRCERLGAYCKRSNAGMRALMERLGFRLEGVARRYWGVGRENDALCYGMLKSECRWL